MLWLLFSVFFKQYASTILIKQYVAVRRINQVLNLDIDTSLCQYAFTDLPTVVAKMAEDQSCKVLYRPNLPR